MALPAPKETDLALYQKLKDKGSVAAFFEPGYGKTLSSIRAAKELNLPQEIVAPASLKGNWQGEYKKWLGSVPFDNSFVSHQALARNPEALSQNPARLLTVDESQAMRNPRTNLYQHLKVNNALHRMVLSGSPTYNSPHDIAAPINFVAGKEVLPENPAEFDREYIEDRPVNPGLLGLVRGVKGSTKQLAHTHKLKKILQDYVVYRENGPEGFPSVTNSVVKIPMGKQQHALYKAILGKADWLTRYRIKRNLPVDKSNLSKLVPFLNGLRQIGDSNSQYSVDPHKVEQPKVDAAAQFLADKIKEDPSYKGLIYSNYLHSGIDPLSKRLQELGVPYGEFTGRVNDRERNNALKAYNKGKLKALLLSGAGSTGLSTIGTRSVGLLDPTWSPELSAQISHRAIRRNSHTALPPEKQNVEIRQYLSTLPKPWFGKPDTSADEYIYTRSLEKKHLNDQMYDILRSLK